MGLREALAKVAEVAALRTGTPTPPPISPASTQTPISAAAPQEASPLENPDVLGSWSKFGKVAVVTGAVVGAATVSVVAAPVVIGALGFTATGITGG